MKDEQDRLEWVQGNDIRLLQNGADFFPALCAAIDAATVSVHLETYIFMLDRTGTKVLECLSAAARRGVKVRVVLDGFGSALHGERVRTALTNAGAQCRIFRPEPRWFARFVPSRSRLRRLHRKVTIVDGHIAFIGGINVIDDYDDLDPTDGLTGPRFDFAVQVEGPLVTQAAHAQELLWVRLNWARLRRHPRDWHRLQLLKPRDVPAPPGGMLRAALVLRDNLRFRRTFERAYLFGISRARRDILIANAYFFPGVRFRRALAKAAARGVRVRLLLQGKVEYRMQYHATRSLYDKLLRDGIEIYEYMPSYLHAKVAVIDNVATVGSSNLDPFSLLLAREANVAVYDATFANTLRARLERAMDQRSARVIPEAHAKLPRLRRFANWAAYYVLRMGVVIAGVTGRY